MDKAALVTQLAAKLKAAMDQARRFSDEARTEAKTGAARAVNLALGHGQRSAATREALDALEAFRPMPMKRGEPIRLGAVVEVEDGQSGRTLFLAPVGAGEELTGPDGDGLFQVVTPTSPFGRAVMGKRVGDSVEVVLGGEPTEWAITFAA